MGRKVLILVLAITLGCCGAGPAIAGGLGYTMKSMETGFGKSKTEPTSAVMFADAVIGRPLGLATTIAATGVFIGTLPLTVGGGNLEEYGRIMVGRAAGWTFVRPVGRGDPRYEDPGVFGR
jgi:hypothetical protein